MPNSSCNEPGEPRHAIHSNHRRRPGLVRVVAGEPAQPGAAQPVITPETSAGQAPSLEQDMVALSTNALHYQALARVLSRYFSIQETIAGGGRS
jgi:hypothetical protein